MKLSRYLFTLLTATILLFSTTVTFAATKPSSPTNPRTTTSDQTYSYDSHTYDSTNNPYDYHGTSDYRIGKDARALTSDRFTMPEPTTYVLVDGSASFARPQRKAPIRRKGRFQH